MKKLLISEQAYRKMFAYAEICDPKEVLFLLSIEELEGNEGGLLVDDVILPKQEVSGGGCNLKIDKTVTTLENPEKIRGWAHSHVHMGSFHSGTDDSTLEAWGGGKTKFSISIVISLPNEIKAWIQYFKPIEINKKEIPVVVLWNDDEALYTSCQKEVDEKVSEKTYSWQTFGQKKDDTKVETATAITDKTIQTSIKNGKPIIEPLGTINSGECPHKMINKRGKPYCFIKGKLDCENCDRDPRRFKKKNKSEIVIYQDCPEFGGGNKEHGYKCAIYGLIYQGCDQCPIAPATPREARIVKVKM